ncbi:MAG: VWA domain-containing protein [Deltaproteobacteria bacterium]|nr:VWA domain-containing protein [Deltaproteobacteria bacterium]
MKSCEQIRELIAEHGAQENADLAGHISTCPGCATFMRAASELETMFVEYREIDAPQRAVKRVLHAVGLDTGVAMEQMEQSDTEHSEEVAPQKNLTRRATPTAKPFWRRRVFTYSSSSFALAATIVLTITFLGQQASVSFQRIGSSVGSANGGGVGHSPRPVVSTSEAGQRGLTSDKLGGDDERENSPNNSASTFEGFRSRTYNTRANSNIMSFGFAESGGPTLDGPLPDERVTESQPDVIATRAQSTHADSSRYGLYDENPRIATANQPVSTFSIDVDTGSYTNVRQMLERGVLPPPSAVRIEEFVNYFTYNYPQERNGKPFTVRHEIAPSPLSPDRHLLKLGLKANPSNPINEDKGWNLVFLIDVSGSMSDSNKLPLLKEGFRTLVRKMRNHDRVAIVTYAGSTGVLLDSTPGTDKERILRALDSLAPGGSTNGAGGIEEAYRVATENRRNDGVNRVILATDGDFNVGVTSFDALVDLVEQKRKGGITLTTLGFGYGNYNEQNLEQLANKGNGNYFYIDSLKEGERVLGSQLAANMEVVAKDVKVQIEFNPAVVKAYRLIGYDNRRLQNEDFANDAIDAGEIGAGHTVTALYEVLLAGSSAASEVDGSLRYQRPASPAAEADSTDEFAFLKIRYKEPNGNISALAEYPLAKGSISNDKASASEDFRFAAAVVGFGALLRESRYIEGKYTLGAVKELVQGSIGSDELGERREFLKLVGRAQELSRNKQ